MAYSMGMNEQWAAEIRADQEEERWRAAHEPKPLTIDTSALMRNSDDSQLAMLQTELLSRVFSLQSEVESLSRDVNAAEIRSLKAQHKQAWAAARRAKDSLKAMTETIGDAENSEREVSFEYGRESAQLASVHATIPRLQDYPLEDEYRQYDKRVDIQKKKMQKVEERWQIAKNHLQSLLCERNERQEAFNRAKDAVEAIQKKINLLEGKRTVGSSLRFSETMGLSGA